jgi:hypothetical protein
MTMPVEEFLSHIREIAAACGYDLSTDQHPEDFANNITPVMQAWAAGYGVGYRKGIGK